MNPVSTTALAHYWSAPALEANVVIILNLVGSFILGLFVGYERSYRGRAAGMRTYGLVCMASTALTVIGGYSAFWYGGQANIIQADPTRVVQGIVTGIGFLGAGVIMKEGLNITGLTTAASIWASSVIGVLIGAGFYAAAIVMAIVSALGMGMVSKLEDSLPQRAVISVVVRFKKGYSPSEDELHAAALARGYSIHPGSLAIHCIEGAAEWHFAAEAFDKRRAEPVSKLANELMLSSNVGHFTVSTSRN